MTDTEIMISLRVSTLLWMGAGYIFAFILGMAIAAELMR